MPLIDCPDCGRLVSDAAVACPDRARPIASVLGRERAVAASAGPVADAGGRRRAVLRPVSPREAREGTTAAPAAVRTSAAPAALSALEEQVKLARAAATVAAQEAPKKCKRCGQDVRSDPFRAKRGDGYVCMDCLDDEAGRAFQRRQRMRRGLVALATMLVLAGSTVGILYTASHIPVKSASK